MSAFLELKNQINHLSCSEYRYDRLVADFSEHYLELKRSGYKVLPDIKVLHTWLKHLNFVLRPELLGCWKSAAEKLGFSLGDLIEVNGTKIYAIRASAYPDLDCIVFTGFGVKKNNSPSQISTTVDLEEDSKVIRLGKRMDENAIEPLFFEGSCRLDYVNEFLKLELSQIA